VFAILSYCEHPYLFRSPNVVVWIGGIVSDKKNVMIKSTKISSLDIVQ